MNKLIAAAKAVIDYEKDHSYNFADRVAALRAAVERAEQEPEPEPVARTAKHIHADLIHAWAEGAEIQWQEEDGTWHDLEHPTWGASCVYRIKPRQPVRLSDAHIDRLITTHGGNRSLARAVERAIWEKNQ